MRRRSPGEGSVSYVTSRGTWLAQLTLPDGSRKTVGRAKTEAAARKLLETAKRGERELAVRQASVTTADYLADWLERQRTYLEPSWWVRVESLLRLHITPALGRWPLRDLAPAHLARLYADKSKTLSPQTVHHIHAILHRALGEAVRWGMVECNVAGLVDAPKVRRVTPRTLTEDETGRFLTALQSDPYRPLWLLLLATGMREGEALALRWGDIDLDAGAVTVRRNVQRVWKQGMIEGDTKSHRPRRVIVPGLAVAALLEWRTAHDTPVSDALVFANQSGKALEVSNLRARVWLPLLKRAGIEHLKVHELRHSAATLLLRLGTHPRVVAEMLGHADPGVTMRVYSHVLPALHQEAAGDYGRFLDRLASPAHAAPDNPLVTPGTEQDTTHAISADS